MSDATPPVAEEPEVHRLDPYPLFVTTFQERFCWDAALLMAWELWGPDMVPVTTAHRVIYGHRDRDEMPTAEFAAEVRAAADAIRGS